MSSRPLLKKAFRNWSSVDTEYKRQRMRNILSNAAAAHTTSDDVVRLFIDWVNLYSDFHFEVVGEVYRSPGITRGEIWDNLGRPQVREDSADADLFKMLIRDLSTGSVLRQVLRLTARAIFCGKHRCAARHQVKRHEPPSRLST